MADRSYRKHWSECGQECAGDCWSQPSAPSPQASTQPPPIPREECENNVPGSGTSRKPLIEYPPLYSFCKCAYCGCMCVEARGHRSPYLLNLSLIGRTWSGHEFRNLCGSSTTAARFAMPGFSLGAAGAISPAPSSCFYGNLGQGDEMAKGEVGPGVPLTDALPRAWLGLAALGCVFR